MKHLGDITKLNGAEIPAVDVICGGSPCQDLSVAGKRAGLAGARSGLFMDQIRIIKEMRENDRRNGRADKFIRPRFMVWENVPGAFSSNKGEDFRAVLEETSRVADKDAVIPGPPNGKWSHSGCIMGDGWSIAWRVHDAQFWGVPQRRKRIALVADFGGECAPEILFERESVSGNTEKSGKEGKEATGNVGAGIEETSRCLNGWDIQSKHIQPEDGRAESLYSGECRYGGGESYVLQNGAISFQERAGKPGGGKGILIQDEHTGALSTLNNQSVCYGISSYDSNAMKSSNPHSGIYEADTSRTLDLNGGSPACNQDGMAVVCLEGNGSRPSHQGDGWHEGDPMYTLNSTEHHAIAIENHPADSRVKISEDGIAESLYENYKNSMVVAFAQNQRDEVRDLGDKSASLSAEPGVHQQTYVLEGNGSLPRHRVNGYVESQIGYTLNGTEHHAVCIENHPADSRVKISEDGVCQTLSSRMGTGGGNVPMVMESEPILLESNQNHATIQTDGISTALPASMGMGGGYVPMVMESINGDISGTLDASYYKGCGERQGVEREVVCVGNGQLAQAKISDKVGALNCMHDQQAVITYNSSVGALCTDDYKGPNRQYVEQDKLQIDGSVVRRLTPMECERLQGFPDGWTDIGDWVDSRGKTHKGEADSPRYKALGNSIALPFWQWMAGRMVSNLGEHPTMASLFDGIGGFPLVFGRCGCEPVWNSEIESFPEAVTRVHFGDDERGIKGDYEQYL